MKEATVCFLDKLGFNRNGINNLRSFYPNDEQFDEAVLALVSATLSKPQIYHELTKGRGAGKSHASAHPDTGEIKRGYSHRGRWHPR